MERACDRKKHPTGSTDFRKSPGISSKLGVFEEFRLGSPVSR